MSHTHKFASQVFLDLNRNYIKELQPHQTDEAKACENILELLTNLDKLEIRRE